MPRRVYFSFHDDDVTRANVVRNADVVTSRYERASRFADSRLWEVAKDPGDPAVKRTIDDALAGTSVTCVLVGPKTWARPWVRYEILKSMARGNGLLAVQIHDIGFAQPPTAALPKRPPAKGKRRAAPKPPRGASSPALNFLVAPAPGPNPFAHLGYAINRTAQTFSLYEIDQEWKRNADVGLGRLKDAPWLKDQSDSATLAELFPTYGWQAGVGHVNFPAWVEAAASAATEKSG